MTNTVPVSDLLKKIVVPADLRRVPQQQLPQVCNDLRQFIINHVSLFGGHFGASLGVVELTVALHYIFDTPLDRLVWDVGHQAYGHKILTGRREIFHTNRLFGGISGFPRRAESEYDSFGVGHSSTSISAALGMALASHFQNDPKQIIAVIGDGAMTAGMAFEALNHCGDVEADILIILNDNCMSIDPNVGALKNYLTKISTSDFYNKIRDQLWTLFRRLNKYGGENMQEIFSRFEKNFKYTFLKHSNFFESLNIRYFGPLDGHDVLRVTDTLRELKKIKGPKLLHCLTVKGKGFAQAEKEQTKWHATGGFNKNTGLMKKSKATQKKPLKYQEVFGKTIIELAKDNKKIIAITPAMPSGSSLTLMMEVFPERVLDVGIAEQHAVTLSAGLATEGMIPFCHIYSTFMQRAYDQVIHDVCIQNLPVNFILDRAGFAGADGATHHGNFDLAYMRCLPNIVVMAPINDADLRNMLYTMQLERKETAFCVRYPRGSGVLTEWQTPLLKVPIGKAKQLKEGDEIAVLSIGHIGNYVISLYDKIEEQEISIAHFDMRFVKPLDEELLHKIASNFTQILTVEDGCLMGGFGSAVGEFILDHGYDCKLKRLGIPDAVFEQGEQLELHQEAGFCSQGILNSICELHYNSQKKSTLAKIPF